MKGKASVLDKPAIRSKIEQRAYELYVLGGYEHGHDVEHWLQAEQEVLSQTSSGSVKPKTAVREVKSASA